MIDADNVFVEIISAAAAAVYADDDVANEIPAVVAELKDLAQACTQHRLGINELHLPVSIVARLATELLRQCRAAG